MKLLALLTLGVSLSLYAEKPNQSSAFDRQPNLRSSSGLGLRERLKQLKNTDFNAAGPRAATCNIPSIDAQGSASGSLVEGDCLVSDLLDPLTIAPARREFFADAYRIDITKASILKVEMRSTQLDSYIYLLRVLGGPSVARDDNTLGDRNSTFSINLPAGSYILVATSAAKLTGEYQITTKTEDRRECQTADLAPGQQIDGDLGDPDCRFIDSTTGSTNLSFVDSFKLRAPKTSLLKLSATAPSIDTFLGLSRIGGGYSTYDDNNGGGSNPLILTSLTAGDYFITVDARPGTSGPYKLSAAFEDLRNCSAQTLVSGEQKTGELIESDCRALDVIVPSPVPINLDLYDMELAAPKVVTLTMRSAAVDAYLLVRHQDGSIIAGNDDFEEGTTDSRIMMTLPAGKHSALASSYDVETGSYALQYEAADLRPCNIQNHPVPGVNLGNITPEDCRVMDFLVPGTETDPIDVFEINLDRASVLTFDAKSSAFDAALVLMNDKRQFLSGDNDSGSGTDARLEVLLRPGKYYTIVTPLDEGMGPYELGSTAQDPKECAFTPVAAGTPLNSTLSSSDCRYREFVPVSTVEYRAEQFELNLTEKQDLDIRANGEFPAVVFLMTADYQPVRAVRATATGLSQLTATAGPGKYIVVVSTLDGVTGSYTLTVNGTPAAASTN